VNPSAQRTVTPTTTSVSAIPCSAAAWSRRLFLQVEPVNFQRRAREAITGTREPRASGDELCPQHLLDTPVLEDLRGLETDLGEEEKADHRGGEWDDNHCSSKGHAVSAGAAGRLSSGGGRRARERSERASVRAR
jgi:hypothetical protein